MAELVHELNFFEHVRPVRRQLIHLQHHHLTRHFVRNLENERAQGGLVAHCDAQSRRAVIDVRSYDRCIRNRSDSSRGVNFPEVAGRKSDANNNRRRCVTEDVSFFLSFFYPFLKRVSFVPSLSRT